MTEITCPQCGADNPLQSKFCNRCGASFVSDTIHICTTCGTANPISLLYCDECGTRLVDDSAQGSEGGESGEKRSGRSEPFSLPARPPGQTGNLDVSGDLPDWLRTGDFAGDEIDQEDELPWLRAAQEDDSWEDADAPTLEELSRDHAPQDDLPTWLLDEETAESIFTGEKSTDELFMSSLGPGNEDDDPSPPAEEEEAAPRSTAEELHGWLSDLEETEVTPAVDGGDEAFAGEAPSAEIEPDAEPAPAELQPDEMAEDDFLQWLSKIQQETADTSEETPPDLAADDLSGAPGGDEWDSPEPAAESAGQSVDAPDWLADLSDAFAVEGDSGEPASQGSAETPDWLFEPVTGEEDLPEGFDYLEESAPEDGSAEGEPELALDFPAIDAGTEDAVTASGDTDEFLQWLESLDSGEQTPAEEAAAETAAFDLGAEIDTQALDSVSSEADYELPDWLGSLAEPDEAPSTVEAASIDALPDWLQDLAPRDGELSLPYVSGTEAETAETEIEGAQQATVEEPDLERLLADADDRDLPEWIVGVSAELEGADGAPQLERPPAEQDEWEALVAENALLGDATSLDPQAVAREDLPDWFSDILEGIETEEEGLQATPLLPNVPEQLAGDHLPEWLDSPFVDESAAEPTPLEEIPEWLRAPLKERLARAAEERGLDESTLDSGQEWRELLEAPLTAAEEFPAAGHDIVPSWLASLRSSAQEQLQESGAVAETGDEATDPIADIQGTIGIAPIVSRTPRSERTAGGVGPKEQEQQVLLLRQLARLQQEETVVAVPATGGVSPLPLATRLVLSLLLLALIIAGIFSGDIFAGFVRERNDEVQPALFTALSDGAGQPALVIFDYSPATASVLDPAAHELLQQLAAQGRQPLLFSQSAAGLAMARRAAEESGVVDAIDLGFVPGEAIGVRRLGLCIEAASGCESLFGQAIGEEELAYLANTQDVVLLTGDRDSLLAWIEQLEAVETINVSAIVTPALEPVARPYAASQQLATLTVAAGAPISAVAGVAVNRIAALSLAQWFVAAAALVGSVYYLLIAVIRARRI